MAAGQAADNNFNNVNGLNPIIFSKKVALQYGKKSKMLELITNDDWEGDIKSQGDRVRIVLPNTDGIAIADGSTCPVIGSVDAEALDLVIDRQKTFAFAVTDKEKAQTQFKNLEDGYANVVAQRIATMRAEEVQRAIFEYTAGTAYTADTALPASTTVQGAVDYTEYDPANHPLAGDFGTDAAPTEVTPQDIYQFMLKVKFALFNSGAIAADGTYDYSPMTQETQDMRGVFICGTELAAMLLSAWQLSGRSTAAGDIVVKDGVVTRVAGLDVHIDRCLDGITTKVGQGTADSGDGTRKHFTNLPFIAGTKNAITKASQISKVEIIRDPYYFQDIVRGLELYGFKILHPEALVRGVVKKQTTYTTAIPVVVENAAEFPGAGA